MSQSSTSGTPSNNNKYNEEKNEEEDVVEVTKGTSHGQDEPSTVDGGAPEDITIQLRDITGSS